jgi:hypothetical protein
VNVDLSAFVDELAERVTDRVLAELETQGAPAEEEWRLLTVEQVAERLGRSTRWVRQRAKGYTDRQSGEWIPATLPFVQLDGGALAFALEDVQAFARERRIASNPLAGSSNASIPSGVARRRLRAVQKVERDRGAA